MHTGPAPPTSPPDGSSLRVAIVHARWNATIVDALVGGTHAALVAAGVHEDNIVVQSVPGAWELPVAVQRILAASQVRSSTKTTTCTFNTSSPAAAPTPATASNFDSAPVSAPATTRPFDVIVAVGVLIKGESMHFEYISDAVLHGLMRVSLDAGAPVVLGVLTVLSEAQARARAGLDGGGHNHGEDWGRAAVEMAVKRKQWASVGAD